MCAANSRIFVQEGIYDKFLENFAAAAQAVRQGDGFSHSTDQGPVVSKNQLDVRIFILFRDFRLKKNDIPQRVLSYIESGKQEGARIVTGGVRGGGAPVSS